MRVVNQHVRVIGRHMGLVGRYVRLVGRYVRLVWEVGRAVGRFTAGYRVAISSFFRILVKTQVGIVDA